MHSEAHSPLPEHILEVGGDAARGEFVDTVDGGDLSRPESDLPLEPDMQRKLERRGRLYSAMQVVLLLIR